MAAPAAPNLKLRGPSQVGRGVPGQYVNWIVMPHPTAETLCLTQVRTPAEFTHDAFRELVVEAHAACGITVEGAACLLEFQRWAVEGVIVTFASTITPISQQSGIKNTSWRG